MLGEAGWRSWVEMTKEVSSEEDCESGWVYR